MLVLDEMGSNLPHLVRILLKKVVFLILKSFCPEDKKITSSDRKEGHKDEFRGGKDTQ